MADAKKDSIKAAKDAAASRAKREGNRVQVVAVRTIFGFPLTTVALVAVAAVILVGLAVRGRA